MVCNKTNKPEGLGRAINVENSFFFDGSFKDGLLHGHRRRIDKDGKF